jgi:hypothetical protein
VGWDKVPCTATTSGLLYQPQMIGEDDCGAIGGMKIGRGNRSTWRKPAPAPLCPQFPLDRTGDQLCPNYFSCCSHFQASTILMPFTRYNSTTRVLVPWDLRPYFTVSHLRLPFSSPPTTRRVTVEVFDTASTRVTESTSQSYIGTGGHTASKSWC